LDYVLNLDANCVNGLLNDLHEILLHKTVLNGLDLALFTELNCFKMDNLNHLRSLAEAVNRYQSHKWQYPGGDTDAINL
jgi:hypothetical protein